jgi:Secretion system C-terminal sorting domain
LQLSGATAPPAGNQVCVNVFAFGSTCKTRLCTPQGVHSRMSNNVIKGEFLEDVTIYPNPNSGNFNVKVIDFKKGATATLYDSTGKKIKDFDLNKGENRIQDEGLAHGNYYIAITVDAKTDVEQLIIK